MIEVGVGVFAVNSFFRWVKFSFSLTTRKLIWYLAVLTGSDTLTIRNPYYTKISTNFRNPKDFKFSKEKKKINSRSSFSQYCLVLTSKASNVSGEDLVLGLSGLLRNKRWCMGDFFRK